MSKSKDEKDVHVVPHKNGWAVKSEGAEKPHRVTETQKEAIEIGRRVAKNRGSENVIHGRDGRIRDKDSYGNDPMPPKDKKH